MCSPKDRISVFLDLVGFITAAALAALIVAFATPYWYRADPFRRSVPALPYNSLPFESLGLWMLCYRTQYPNNDPYLRYDSECRSFFVTFRDGINFPPIYDILGMARGSFMNNISIRLGTGDHASSQPLVISPFFLATKAIYTIGLAICCIGFIILMVTLFTSATRRFLYALGTLFIIGALIIAGSLIIFGATEYVLFSNNRNEWVFGRNAYSENELFWSYWLAVAGAILIFFCAICYFIEARRVETIVPAQKAVTVTTVYYPSGNDFIPYTAV